jgi:hypothetical protein
MERYTLFSKLVLIGGPPRSGTTLLAKLLNAHPEIVLAVDNSMYECWGLYYYRQRTGLVHELRTREVPTEEAQRILWEHLVKRGQLWGVADSPPLSAYPRVPAPVRPRGVRKNLLRRVKLSSTKSKLVRRRIPLEALRSRYLALKSPEIVFVLPQLAQAFPKAKFVLVYRPLLEVAESMWRKGHEWKQASYHKRWRQEVDRSGNPLVPPGVAEEWHPLWERTSDFQRCILYATSYLRALVIGVQRLSPGRFFLYDHALLRGSPSQVLAPLAAFLDLPLSGFEAGNRMVSSQSASIPSRFQREFDGFQAQLNTQEWMAHARRLSVHPRIGAEAADPPRPPTRKN